MVGSGYCRLQMPFRLALAVREIVAGHRLGAREGGGGGSPPCNATCPPPLCKHNAPCQHNTKCCFRNFWRCLVLPPARGDTALAKGKTMAAMGGGGGGARRGPPPAPASATSWLATGSRSEGHWPRLPVPAVAAVAAAAPQDRGRRRRRKPIRECTYCGCAPCRCTKMCPYCYGLAGECQCWGVEEPVHLPCSVCGSLEPCLCWAEDDEAAIDAAAAKTAATADLVPCSMAACSAQGGLDDKAINADDAFAVSSGPELALPDGSARCADIMEAEEAAIGATQHCHWQCNAPVGFAAVPGAMDAEKTGALWARGAPNTQEASENAFNDLAGVAATCSPAEAVLSVAHEPAAQGDPSLNIKRASVALPLFEDE